MKALFALMPIIEAVLKDPRVIATATAVILFLNFGVYVTRYVRKPKRKRRHSVKEQQAASAQNANADATSNSQNSNEHKLKKGS